MTSTRSERPEVAATRPTELPRLPTGWAWTSLGDVLPLTYGKALPERSRNGQGVYPVFGSSGLVGTHSDSIAPENAIIIGRKGSAGSVYRSQEPSWPIDTAYYTAGTSAINIDYAYWLLIYNRLGSLDQSTAIPSLNRDIYSAVRIPLPPLNEQARIVSRIDELFAEISNGEAALRATQEGLGNFHRSLLRAAVTGDLTRAWRGIHRANDSGADLILRVKAEKAQAAGTRRKSMAVASDEGSLTDDFSNLPEGWSVASFGELFNLFTGATPSRSSPGYWEGDVPWVSSGEVAFCRIKQTKERITLAGLASSSTRLHPVGTVLLAMIGEGKTRGQCAILDIEAANNQNAAAIRVSETSIPPEFVYEFLTYRYEKTRRDGQGGNQPALNLGKVARIRMPVPPLSEIRRIIEIIGEARTAIDDIALLQKQAATDAAVLRRTVLKTAFEGRLVPQDTADEPAAALLARLKAEDPVPTRLRRRRAA